MSLNQNWYAIRVKSNRENLTSQSLNGKGYEVMLPLYRPAGTNRPSVPLFPGYLFSRFDVHDRLPILTIPGVVHIVGVGKVPVPIDEDELKSLRIVLDTDLAVRADEAYSVGQKVRVDKGPLAGAYGTVTGLSNQRFVVSITLLQRSVSVLLQPDWIGAAQADSDHLREYAR